MSADSIYFYTAKKLSNAVSETFFFARTQLFSIWSASDECPSNVRQTSAESYYRMFPAVNNRNHHVKPHLRSKAQLQSSILTITCLLFHLLSSAGPLSLLILSALTLSALIYCSLALDGLSSDLSALKFLSALTCSTLILSALILSAVIHSALALSALIFSYSTPAL